MSHGKKSRKDLHPDRSSISISGSCPQSRRAALSRLKKKNKKKSSTKSKSFYSPRLCSKRFLLDKETLER